MNEKTLEALQQLASKLGTTGEYLWQVMVAGQFAEGIFALVVVLIGMLSVVCSVRLKMPPGDEEPFMIAKILLFVAGVSFTSIFLWQAVVSLITPEYAALRQILDLLK